MASEQISSQPPPEPRPLLPLADDEPSALVATSDDRLQALLCHVGGYFASVIVPLVLYLMLKRSSRFVMHHCREALNFQLSQMIYALVLTLVISVITAIVGVMAGWEAGFIVGAGGWFLLAMVFALIEITLVVVACVATHRGKWFRYPLCLRLVR
jgi:uncharacterized protein